MFCGAINPYTAWKRDSFFIACTIRFIEYVIYLNFNRKISLKCVFRFYCWKAIFANAVLLLLLVFFSAVIFIICLCFLHEHYKKLLIFIVFWSNSCCNRSFVALCFPFSLNRFYQVGISIWLCHLCVGSKFTKTRFDRKKNKKPQRIILQLKNVNDFEYEMSVIVDFT